MEISTATYSKPAGALIDHVKVQTRLYEEIGPSAEVVYLHDLNHVSDESLQARAREKFVSCLRIAKKLPDTLTEDEAFKEAFSPDHINANIEAYIAHVCSGRPNAGGTEQTTKTCTLRHQVEVLWWTFARQANDQIPALFDVWRRIMAREITWAAENYELEAGIWPKSKFGTLELRLLFDLVCQRTRYVNWYKQHYVAWALSYATGAEPGAFAVDDNAGHEPTTAPLKWEDITFFRFADRRGIFLLIDCKALQAPKDPLDRTDPTRRGVQFLLLPCTAVDNLFADCTWLLLALAHERGLFGNRTLEDLETSGESQLSKNALVAKQPVFVALEDPSGPDMLYDTPIQVDALSDILQHSAKTVGIIAHVDLSVFHRELTPSVASNRGIGEGTTTPKEDGPEIIHVIMPGERGDIDGTGGVTSVRDDCTYAHLREYLTNLWTDCVEVLDGPQRCLVCALSVDGDLRPAFAAEGSVAQHSAYDYCRHMKSRLHGSTQQFRIWARDRAMVGTDSYECPLGWCVFNQTSAFDWEYMQRFDFKSFLRHVKARHPMFFVSLGH